MYYLQHYKINFEKVKTLEDVIEILKIMDISFEVNEVQYNVKFIDIKELLYLTDKE